jgi:hypothetical protein
VFIVSVLRLEILLVLLQLALEESDQLFAGLELVLHGSSVRIAWTGQLGHVTRSFAARLVGVGLRLGSRLLQLGVLSAKPFDNFLAEVRPLGELLLNFFVDLNFSFKRFNLFLH